MSRFRTSRAPRIPRPRRRPASSRAELFRRYRRPLAVAFAVLAGASLLSALAPERTSDQQVLTLAMEKPAGSQLLAQDVVLSPVSGLSQVPGLLDDPQQAIGQRLAVGLPAGALLNEQVLIGPQLLTGMPPGSVAVPIRLSDPATVQLLHPGQLVDIVLSSGDGFEQEIISHTIGRRLPVLWVPQRGEGDSLGLLPASGTSGEGIVVVAADGAQADELSGAVTRGKVSAVLVN